MELVVSDNACSMQSNLHDETYLKWNKALSDFWKIARRSFNPGCLKVFQKSLRTLFNMLLHLQGRKNPGPIAWGK